MKKAMHEPTQLRNLIDRAQTFPPVRMAVAAASDQAVLCSIKIAFDAGLVHPILIGKRSEIERSAAAIGLDLKTIELIDEQSELQCAKMAVFLAKTGSAQCLQKGLISTDILMKEVLSKESGIRASDILSHILYIIWDEAHRPLILSDAGVIPCPNVEAKKELILRAIRFAKALGTDWPRVGLLSASEKVTKNIPASMDAQVLTEWWAEHGVGGDVFGPLSLDLCLSENSAKTKKISNSVVGRADIIIAPDIVTANAVYKTLTVYSDAIGAGLVLGAKVPILLTSRSDPITSRVASIAVATIVTNSQIC